MPLFYLVQRRVSIQMRIALPTSSCPMDILEEAWENGAALPKKGRGRVSPTTSPHHRRRGRGRGRGREEKEEEEQEEEEEEEEDKTNTMS